MRRLGYESYGTRQRRRGAMISRELAVLDPPGFLGARVLQLFSFPSGDQSEFERFGPKEYAALGVPRLVSVGGRLQPDERDSSADHCGCAVGFSGRPAGVQRVVRELRQRHQPGDRRASPHSGVRFWLTNTAATAVRFHYSEGHSGAEPVVSQGRMGVAVFAHDFQTIRPLAERDNANIVHWSEFDRAAHYAALEVPELVVI